MLNSLGVLLNLKDVQIRAEASTFAVFFRTFNGAPGGSPEAETQRNPGARRTPNLTILRRLFFVGRLLSLIRGAKTRGVKV